MNWKNLFMWFIVFVNIVFFLYKKEWIGIGFLIYMCSFFQIKSIKIKKMMFQFSFVVGFGCFLISYFVLIPKLLLFGCLALVYGVFMVKNIPQPRQNYQTIQNKIKYDLNISFVKSYKKKFPKIFSSIGGFMIPILPFLTFVNKRWKATKEATLHENIHIWLLLHKMWLIYLILYCWVIYVAFVGKYSMPLKIVFHIILLACFFVFFEKKTYDYSNIMGKKYKIKTRKFNKNLALTYFIIYCIQLGLFFLFWFAISHLFKLIKSVVYLIIGL